MAWIYLALAGLMEIVWAICMKYSEGFTKLIPSAATIAGMAVSVLLLAAATKTLPLGTAYAIWTGIGAAGAVATGILLFHEPAGLAKFLFLGCILIGVIGLKFIEGSH